MLSYYNLPPSLIPQENDNNHQSHKSDMSQKRFK